MKTLRLSPQAYQQEALLDTTTPIIGVAAGKRSGKSRVMIAEKSIYTSSLHPGKPIVVASPTAGMTRRNLLPIYRELNEKMGLNIKGLDIKSPDVLEIQWGNQTSRIHLDVTIENYERINGMSLAAVFGDEIDKARHADAMGFMEEALIRCSNPYPGRRAQLVFCGAPELNGAMAEYFIDNATPDKKLHTWSLMQNMCVSEEYKKRILSTIPMSKRAGWVHGEFMFNNEDVVYSDFDPELNTSTLTLSEIAPNEVIHVMWDINDGGCSCYLGVRRGKQLHVFEEWSPMKNTKAILDKVKNQPWADRALLTCDPAVTQVFAYIHDSKLKHRIMTTAPEISHRITAVNLQFHSASGERNLLISKACRYLRRCLMRQTFKNGVPDKSTQMPEIKTDISGPIDALGYWVYRECPYSPRGIPRLTMRGF